MRLEAADIAAADDTQRLAILEAMLLAVLADGKVSAPERDRFDGIVDALPWGMDKPVLVALLQGAIHRMKGLSTPAAITDFAAGLATRLPSPALREKVVHTMARLAAADGVLHQFEKNVLGMMVVAFNLTAAQVEAIKADIVAHGEA